jgi:hypothetical protein
LSLIMATTPNSSELVFRRRNLRRNGTGNLRMQTPKMPAKA